MFVLTITMASIIGIMFAATATAAIMELKHENERRESVRTHYSVF